MPTITGEADLTMGVSEGAQRVAVTAGFEAADRGEASDEVVGRDLGKHLVSRTRQ